VLTLEKDKYCVKNNGMLWSISFHFFYFFFFSSADSRRYRVARLFFSFLQVPAATDCNVPFLFLFLVGFRTLWFIASAPNATYHNVLFMNRDILESFCFSKFVFLFLLIKNSGQFHIKKIIRGLENSPQ